MKLLIVDDHDLFANSLKAVLEKNGRFEVEVLVCDGTNFNDVLQKDDLSSIDIILLDIHLGKRNGLLLGEQIMQQNPDSKIVFLSGYDLLEFRNQVKKIGARGFFNKNISIDELTDSLNLVMEGKYLFNDEKKDENVLTKREIEVLRLLAEGYRQKEVADILNVSIRTVSQHIFVITRKLDVDSSIGAIVAALKKGILTVIPKE